MSESRPFALISDIGAKLGPLAERHLETTFRSALRGPSFVDTGRFLRLITGEPHPFGNFAVLTRPDDAAATREAIEPLQRPDVPTAALFVGGPLDPSVEQVLAECGFHAHPAMPAMAVDIAALADTRLPPGYSFARSGSGDAQAWTETLAAGYEIPFGVARCFSPLGIPAQAGSAVEFHFFAIMKTGQPVCTSLVALADGLAGVYAVATRPDERGKGLGAHVTAEALRAVRPLGYGVGVLQSSMMGHPVYRRLGFADVGTIPLFVRMPS